jgi:hypothetical protein
MCLFTALLCSLIIASMLAAPGAGAFIYWSANATGLLRATNDGAEFGFFVSTPQFSDAVAIDDQHVYWTSSDGRIGRADISGANPDPNFITGLPDYLPGLAVNGTNIYWSSLTSIGRADLDGGGIVPKLIKTTHASGLALDSQHIYWGENSLGTVGRASLNGRNPEVEFVPAPGDPCSVAVDSSYLYWSDATGNAIGRASLDGSTVEPKFIDPGVPIDCGVAVFQSHIYFGTNLYPSPSSMARVATDGSDLQTVFFSLGVYGGPFVQMAVDGRGPASAGPPNGFKVGKFKRNKRKGTARIIVMVPGPGTLTVFGKQVKKASRKAAEAGKLSLPLRPRRRLMRRLGTEHRALVAFRLKYLPTGGEPATKSLQRWLVKGG